MEHELTLMKLDPDGAENICSALRSWAPVIQDFYRALIDVGAPPDLASGVALSFFEQVTAASFALPDYDD